MPPVIVAAAASYVGAYVSGTLLAGVVGAGLYGAVAAAFTVLVGRDLLPARKQL